MIQKDSKGFTLVEILVYISILTLLSFVAISSIIVMGKSFRSFSTSRDITEAGTIAMERMVREIRTGTDIDDANSVFNANPGQLALVTIDEFSGATSTSRFYISGGRLILLEATSTQMLTQDEVTIGNLMFTKLINGSSTEGVMIKLSIRGGSGSSTRTEIFRGGAILRGEY